MAIFAAMCIKEQHTLSKQLWDNTVGKASIKVFLLIFGVQLYRGAFILKCNPFFFFFFFLFFVLFFVLFLCFCFWFLVFVFLFFFFFFFLFYLLFYLLFCFQWISYGHIKNYMSDGGNKKLGPFHHMVAATQAGSPFSFLLSPFSPLN